jgi:hypothetical protein
MYKNKYLKYKEKYLKLQENQTGGVQCINAQGERMYSTINGSFFDLNTWRHKSELFLINGDQVTNRVNNQLVGRLTVDEEGDRGNFMLYILCNLFGRPICPNPISAVWSDCIRNKDKKIYIIDYANLYLSTFNEYQLHNAATIQQRVRLRNQAPPVITAFQNWFRDKMRRFLTKRIINWGSMVIIINKTIGPNGVDPVDIVRLMPTLHPYIGTSLIVLNTHYIDATVQPQLYTPLAVQGCVDDFCFWMVVIGLVGIFIKLTVLEPGIPPDIIDKVNYFNVNGGGGLKLDHFMRKLRLVTNDKQKIGIDGNMCRYLDADHNKTIFSDLIHLNINPNCRINCNQLYTIPGGIINRASENTYNHLNIFYNICRDETRACYDNRYIAYNNVHNPQLNINSPPYNYCNALIARRDPGDVRGYPENCSVLDDDVNIVKCTITITSMKFAFVTLIAKIQKLIGYTETSMRQPDMAALLFNDMD